MGRRRSVGGYYYYYFFSFNYKTTRRRRCACAGNNVRRLRGNTTCVFYCDKNRTTSVHVRTDAYSSHTSVGVHRSSVVAYGTRGMRARRPNAYSPDSSAIQIYRFSLITIVVCFFSSNLCLSHFLSHNVARQVQYGSTFYAARVRLKRITEQNASVCATVPW